MRRIPWKLSLRYSRKVAITVVGIAIGVCFSVVSFSIAHSLQADTLSIAAQHPADTLVVFASDGSRFDLALLGTADATGAVVQVAVDERGDAVTLLALVGARAPQVDDVAAHPGQSGGRSTEIRLPERTLAVGALAGDARVPPGWFLVAPSTLGASTSAVDHALVPADAPLPPLEPLGLERAPAPGFRPFLHASGSEIARDLTLVVTFSSALSVVFSYEFLRSEVRESRRDIGIWRAVGMRSGDVTRLILARALVTSVLALAIGWVLAALVVGGMATWSGEGALRIAIGPVEAILLSGTFVVASLLGGLLPALVASRISIREAMESAA